MYNKQNSNKDMVGSNREGAAGTTFLELYQGEMGFFLSEREKDRIFVVEIRALKKNQNECFQVEMKKGKNTAKYAERAHALLLKTKKSV